MWNGHRCAHGAPVKEGRVHYSGHGDGGGTWMEGQVDGWMDGWPRWRELSSQVVRIMMYPTV